MAEKISWYENDNYYNVTDFTELNEIIYEHQNLSQNAENGPAPKK
jgi:hypothetical protein